LKNIVGQVDGKVENYRTTIVQLRDKFLARAAVITEVAVLEAGAQFSHSQDRPSRIVDLTSDTQNWVL
jgi:hypothetical protein